MRLGWKNKNLVIKKLLLGKTMNLWLNERHVTISSSIKKLRAEYQKLQRLKMKEYFDTKKIGLGIIYIIIIILII